MNTEHERYLTPGPLSESDINISSLMDEETDEPTIDLAPNIFDGSIAMQNVAAHDGQNTLPTLTTEQLTMLNALTPQSDVTAPPPPTAQQSDRAELYWPIIIIIGMAAFTIWLVYRKGASEDSEPLSDEDDEQLEDGDEEDGDDEDEEDENEEDDDEDDEDGEEDEDEEEDEERDEEAVGVWHLGLRRRKKGNIVAVTRQETTTLAKVYTIVRKTNQGTPRRVYRIEIPKDVMK